MTDSRETEEGLITRRRRECLRCNFRFSTYEEMEILDLMVIKRDGAKEPYVKAKVVGGLQKALEKRPISTDTFKKLVAAIERDIQIKAKAGEISSQIIGELVMKHLKRVDQVAYIRFASVYQSFENADSFLSALSGLLKGPRSKKKGAKK